VRSCDEAYAEEVRLVLLGDADAGVLDLDGDELLLLLVVDNPHRHPAALRRELDRVAH
jgi:hypothetical protein